MTRTEARRGCPAGAETMHPECTCCGKPLTGRVVYLELSTRTGRYSHPGEVSPDESQGAFPFGRGCARKALTPTGSEE